MIYISVLLLPRKENIQTIPMFFLRSYFRILDLISNFVILAWFEIIYSKCESLYIDELQLKLLNEDDPATISLNTVITLSTGWSLTDY